MKISQISNSQLQNRNEKLSFKAVNANSAKSHLMELLFKKDIQFYSMDEVCMHGIEAYKTRVTSPCLGEFLSNVQISVLKNSEAYKKILITDAEATKLKLEHPKAVFDKLLEIMQKPQNVKISDLFEDFDRLRTAKSSKNSQAVKQIVGEIEEKYASKLDNTDYFTLNATRKYPDCKPRRFYPN